jgi:serine phosphatase RsbU (regulator of sigma subunit)
VLLERTERFCTISYVRLRRRDGGVRLMLASGGHPPPYVVSASGDVRAMQTTGSLIGVFEHWDGADLRAGLDAGDALVLYSDGVLEARRPGGREVFGAERLEQVLAEHRRASAQDIVRAIERAVFEFSGGDAGDDVALLVARVMA